NIQKLLGFVILAAIFASCGPKNEFTINGTVTDRDLNGQKIYIYRYDENGDYASDSAVIKNNKFQIKGISEEPAIFYAFIDAPGVYGSIALGVPLLVKPGKITYKIVGDEAIIGGNEENERYQQLIDKQMPIMKQMDELSEKFDTSTQEEEKERLREEYSLLKTQVDDANREFIYENIDNPFGKDLFLGHYYLLTLEEIKELLSKTDESFSSHPEVVDIIAFMTPKGKFPKGTKYIDFTLLNKENEEVSLSDYVGKGKYVLIDFWASWCAPCLQEMPDLVEFYNQLKNEKFEIVGVSLDEDKEQWLKTIREYKMTWPQMADMQQSSPATGSYNVSHIPYTVLIDPQGFIIADGLRGQELEEAILHALNIPHEH
ncbi:MAG: AhpC/TSA family protein, partial [Bacteroidales bacterium]|nr:AhpC/TSA family protein [Bacteroidales bacterium]